mgnify:CR=1 FL=1
MKRTKITIILISLMLILSFIAAGMSLAIWIQQEGASVYLEFTVDDDNPSIRYQIFVPVDSNGDKIDGTMDVASREYTLYNSEDYSNIAGYALVGWDGGINYKRMEVPDNYTMNIDGLQTTMPSVRIFVDMDFLDYEFSGNNTIEEMIISENIEYIAQGVFQNMLSLSALLFAGQGEIEIGDYAFASCHNLSMIDSGQRTIIGDEALIFFRS